MHVYSSDALGTAYDVKSSMFKKKLLKNFVFFLAKTGRQKPAFFHFFKNVFFGGLLIKNNERKSLQKMFLKLLWIFFRKGGFQKNVYITPYRVSQKYFPLIFEFFRVLLSIIAIAGSNFAYILIRYSRNRINSQICNISGHKVPLMTLIYQLWIQWTYRTQIQNTNTLGSKWLNKK